MGRTEKSMKWGRFWVRYIRGVCVSVCMEKCNFCMSSCTHIKGINIHTYALIGSKPLLLLGKRGFGEYARQCVAQPGQVGCTRLKTNRNFLEVQGGFVDVFVKEKNTT